MKRLRLDLIAILMLAAALRLHDLGRQSLWMDEIFCVVLAQLPLGQMLKLALIDGGHPPLYYLFEEIVVPLGASEFVARWPMAMLGVLAVGGMVRLGQSWFGRRGASMAGLLLAVSPFAVWYGREARMYSLLVALWVVVMGLFASWAESWDMRLTRARKSGAMGAAFPTPVRWRQRIRLGLFVALSACLYLTHYFGLFAALVQFSFLIFTFRRNYRWLRMWTGLQLAAGLPIGVWLVAVFRRELNYFGIGWIERPGPWDLVLTAENFAIGYGDEPWRWGATAGFLALAALGVWVIGRSRSSSGQKALLVTLWLLLPPVAAAVFSLKRAVYVDRFLIGSLPPLILAVTAGLTWLVRHRRILGWGIAVILVGASGLGTMTLLSDPEYSREQWREAAEFLQAHERRRDRIAVHWDHMISFQYYYRGVATPEPLENAIRTSPIAGARGRLWIVYRGRLNDAHRFAESLPADFDRDEESSDVREWLFSLEPQRTQRYDFTGVTLLLYDLSFAED